MLIDGELLLGGGDTEQIIAPATEKSFRATPELSVEQVDVAAESTEHALTAFASSPLRRRVTA